MHLADERGYESYSWSSDYYAVLFLGVLLLRKPAGSLRLVLFIRTQAQLRFNFGMSSFIQTYIKLTVTQ